MSVFTISTEPERKKRLLFRIYDKENRGAIPILEIKKILNNDLFVRSHYSEAEVNMSVKSSYSERVMRTVMDEVMVKFDRDTNKQIDYSEF